jgi:hypothetical protein
LTAHGASVAALAGDQLHVAGLSGEQIGTLAAQQAIPLFETVTEREDLEDIFLQLTTGAVSAPAPEREAVR